MSSYSVYIHVFPNKKVYVGITSQEPRKRWANGNGYKTGLMKKAIDKYGWENVEHEIVAESLTKEQAAKMERDLISAFKSTDKSNGYNLSDGGECGTNGVPRTKEWREKDSTAHKKQVVQYLLDGNPIKTHNSVMCAAESVNGSFRVISANCNRKKRTAYGYVWRFVGDGFDLPEKKTGGHHKIAKRTVAFKDGEKVAEFESAYQASIMTGITKQNIIACCNKKAKSAGGYEWQYAKEGENNADTE